MKLETHDSALFNLNIIIFITWFGGFLGFKALFQFFRERKPKNRSLLLPESHLWCVTVTWEVDLPVLWSVARTITEETSVLLFVRGGDQMCIYQIDQLAFKCGKGKNTHYARGSHHQCRWEMMSLWWIKRDEVPSRVQPPFSFTREDTSRVKTNWLVRET